MKKIPLVRRGNALVLNARINNSFHTDFQLDTGCWSTVLSKEIADLLYLSGKLKDEDITGHHYSSWGNHYRSWVATAVIKKLSFGRFCIRNVQTDICDRYDGPVLFGMSCLDKLKDYSIKEDCILINDGKEENNTPVGKKVQTMKNFVRHCNYMLKKLHKVRELHPEANYRFDYKDWCLGIYTIINSCGRPLYENGKCKKVISVLEELQPLIQKNLEYDQEHIEEHGSFITGYFNFYLAWAYYQAKRMEDALGYYEKALPFFMEGSSIRQDIVEKTEEIKREIQKKRGTETYEPEKKPVPMRTMDLEGDVKLQGLDSIEIVDNVYGKGERRNALMGFKDFDTAFDFSITYHKRLEIVKRVDGVWYRTDKIPTEDLAANDLPLGDKYMYCNFKSEVEKKAKELTDALNDKNNELAERIEQNKTEAIEAIEAFPEFSWKHNVVLNKEDLLLDSVIHPGCSLQWHDTDIAICAIDVVDDSIARRLADDVLAGKFIPCAIGQMPEDFLFLHEESEYFRAYNADEYKGDNNPDYSKWFLDDFIVMDDEGCIGYSHRRTYDNIHWRWEGGEHANQCGLMKPHEDINKNVDHKFCYWQWVRKFDARYTSYISCKPY